MMMRRSDLVQHSEKHQNERTTQIVFGERQHLLRVLDSLETSEIPQVRVDQERRMLEQLIYARTQELNDVNENWDEKVGVVLSSDVKPEVLEKLAREDPKEDYYLLRLISEHPRVSAKTLARLAKHSYGAIRENVARHPKCRPRDTFLVSTRQKPTTLVFGGVQPEYARSAAAKLQERLRKIGQTTSAK